MGLYELKMYLKRLHIVKFILKKRSTKEEQLKEAELKTKGLTLIKEVENALKNYGISYFADYGTLLGIIRDHDFISWDNDIDYGIIISDGFDWEAFERHMKQYGFHKVKQFCFHKEIKEQTYRIGTVTVDFFGHQNKENRSVVHVFYRKADYIYHSRYEHHVRMGKYVKLERMKKVPFYDIEVSVPENAEAYLADVYSENWRIPDPDWSVKKHSKDNIEMLSDLGYGEFFE